MNLSPLSLMKLAAVVLSLAVIPASLPVKAQSYPLQIAQASETANNAQLQKTATEVINLLVSGKYEQVRQMASSDLVQKLSAQQIEQIWSNLIQTTGPVKKQLKSRVVNTINADLVIINTQFEKTKGDFIVIFDKKGQIVGMDFPKVNSIDEISEIFVNALGAGDYTKARGYLHPFLKTEVFPQQIQSKWESVVRKYGKFEKIASISDRPGSTVDSTDVVIVTVKFQKGTQDLFIIFDEEKRITGVDIPTMD